MIMIMIIIVIYYKYKGFSELACIKCLLDLKKNVLIQQFWRTSNIAINLALRNARTLHCLSSIKECVFYTVK